MTKQSPLCSNQSDFVSNICHAAVQMYDADRSGCISKDELAAVLRIILAHNLNLFPQTPLLDLLQIE